MSENAQVPFAQKSAENPSKAFYSDPNWQTDFDAWNGIQFILYLMSVPTDEYTWSDAIQHELDGMGNCTRVMSYSFPVHYLEFSPSDAAKLIASIAKPLFARLTDSDASFDQYAQGSLGGIIDQCKKIDPSSVS